MDVLLVEDDPRVARLVARSLSEAGHGVEVAHDGRDGLDRARARAWDAILLDVLLPGLDGFEVCRALRREQIGTPILMLTARDAVPDRVRGLDSGADDYLVKPFAPAELLARLRAVARRALEQVDQAEILRVGDLTMDLDCHEARRAGSAIELTSKEFRLLEYLMRHPGQVLTRDQILSQVWGYDAENSSNVVDIYIHYLRDKIDRGFPRPLIRTVRGIGYTVQP